VVHSLQGNEKLEPEPEIVRISRLLGYFQKQPDLIEVRCGSNANGRTEKPEFSYSQHLLQPA